MKVVIRTERIRLRFPVPLFFLRLVPHLPDSWLPEMGALEKDAARALYDALRAARRNFRRLELVHVRSASGEEIIVTL